MRLIDADALMQTLGITDMDCAKCKWYSRAYRQCKRGGDFEDACTAIEDAPAIEPQRMRGRWIDKSEGRIEGAWPYCSVCDDMSVERFDFCPNCGARMSEGEEDE